MITRTDLRIAHQEMPTGRCLAGFSGGADSTALIYLLAEERDTGRTLPEAVHVNHGLRGKESDEDEDFCRSTCRRLGIPFHCFRADLDGKKDEDACRKARFECFRDVMKKTGISQLVLAHNQDDVAETFIMRLMRGAGTEGLSCMGSPDEYEGFRVFRPFLNAGRNEIRDAMRQAGIPWREDSLNKSSEYFRNRIRNKLLPMMEEMVPGVVTRIAQTATILRDENRFLQQQADSFLDIHCKGFYLDVKALDTVPESLHARILRTWWKRNAPVNEEHTLNARQTTELLGLTGKRNGKVNLPSGLFAVRCRNGLYMTGFSREVPEEIPYGREPAKMCGISLKTMPTEGNPGDGARSQEVPVDFVRDCVIRTRRPGDRIRPFGMKGSRKLQDYLTDRGVDEPWRDMIPLLCRENEVLLVAGVGAGAIPPWKPEEENIRLVWSGNMPWEEKREEVSEQ